MHVACDRLHVELVIREVTDIIISAQIKTILFSLSLRRGPAGNVHIHLFDFTLFQPTPSTHFKLVSVDV